ncbi:hypothetical protein [Rhodoplanes azumiensis]|uniref:SMODS and SLOG-associating 2TM effector domain-containing protein n=1 Tax=Rhodoplanes azumiensis TaxID=1897628 RepID=A0ABW5APC1_9BRAD
MREADQIEMTKEHEIDCLEDDIRRIDANILNYYSASSDQLQKSYRIYKRVSVTVTALAAGTILFSSLSAANGGFLDVPYLSRGASIAAAGCGLFITILQLYWSRSGHAQHSSVHRSICIEAKKARSRISRKLLLALDKEPTERRSELEDLQGYAGGVDLEIHNLLLSLTEIPSKIESVDDINGRDTARGLGLPATRSPARP